MQETRAVVAALSTETMESTLVSWAQLSYL